MYVHNKDERNRNNINVNNVFDFQMTLEIIRNDDNPKPLNVEECRHRDNDQNGKKSCMHR